MGLCREPVYNRQYINGHYCEIMLQMDRVENIHCIHSFRLYNFAQLFGRG